MPCSAAACSVRVDIPAVDWIIQYDPPDDPKEYIHRVSCCWLLFE
jgi:hypothetical protein